MYKLGLSAFLVASVSAACWSEKLGFNCCSSSSVKVEFTDADGKWGIEGNDWCGIPEPEAACWSESMGFSCCPAGTPVSYTDADGKWGVVNNDWCGIADNVKTTTTKTVPATKPVQSCWAKSLGFDCCPAGTAKIYSDADGDWGLIGSDWCGIIAGATTTRKSSTTTRKTTTTTRKTTTKKASYTVIYETANKLPTGYQNWGYDSSLKFADGAMVVTADPDSYGAVSLKNMKGTFKAGSLRMDVKCANSAEIVVESTDDEELESIGIVPATSDYKTVIFDITLASFDRINIKDKSGKGTPIYVRYIIHSTGSAEGFVDPIDTTYVPQTTTRKVVTNAKYTTIFTTVSSMPSGYENWGWGCTISYSGGAMVIKPKEGDYGAVSLKKTSGTFKQGSLRFDMKNEGKVNIMVENTSLDEAYNIATINASDEWVTHILDITYDEAFDRINFQDAKGTGDTIYVKNLVHSTGDAENFVDPI